MEISDGHGLKNRLHIDTHFVRRITPKLEDFGSLRTRESRKSLLQALKWWALTIKQAETAQVCLHFYYGEMFLHVVSKQ